MNGSDLLAAIMKDIAKWEKTFDSKNFKTIGQEKEAIDFRSFLETNQDNWNYQEYRMDLSFQG